MHQLYKITNKINNKYYIGVHSGDIFEDNYYGSGTAIKHAIKKYGRDKFNREVITEFEDEMIAYMAEELVVDEDIAKDGQSYNMKEGGRKPPVWVGEDNYMYGRTHTDEVKERLSIMKRGRRLTEDQKQKIRENAKPKSGDEHWMSNLSSAELPRSIKVVHIETGKIFGNGTLASKWYGCSKSVVSEHCNNNVKKPKFKFIDTNNDE